MAVTFANATNVQPLVNAEVVVATIAGPLDNLDAFAQGGSWADGTLVFFIYATVGAVRAKVAVGIFGGPTAARITWKDPSGEPIEGSVHAGGTSYDLVVFAQPNQSYQPATPAPINATFAGVDQGDVAADANVSGTASTGATIATAAGYNQFADVSARMAGLPGAVFQLLASCGAGSVEAIVETAQTGGPDATAVVMKGIVLPVATSYRIVAQPIQPGTSFNVTASLATYFTSASAIVPPTPANSNAIIYRPGAPSAGVFVATWAEVQTFIALHSGACIVFVDDAIVSPAHVPGASGVTECFGRVELRSYNTNIFSAAVLQIDDGATLRNLALLSGNIFVNCDAKTAPSLDYDWAPNNQLVLSEQASIQDTLTATRSAVTVAAGQTFGCVAHLLSTIKSNHAGPGGFPLFSAPATASIFLFALGSSIGQNVAGGAGNFSLFYDDDAAFETLQSFGFLPGQAGLLAIMPHLSGTYTSIKSSANSYMVDFVADCGADPTGVGDCAPALDAAYNILKTISASQVDLPIKSLVLNIPPGLYSIRSNVGNPNWDFVGATTSLTIHGHGDASIFQFFGFNGVGIVNIPRVTLQDLTCIGGLQNFGTPDCQFCFLIAASEIGVIERCKFADLLVSFAVVRVTNGSYSIRDCVFGDCGCTDATQGVLFALECAQIDMERCNFVDISNVNGHTPIISKAAVNVNWFRYVDSNAIGTGGQTRQVRIAGCFFDESAVRSIFISGGPTSNPVYVKIEGVLCNPPGLGATVACLDVENVGTLEIDGFIDTGFNTLTPAAAIKLVGVESTTLRRLTVNQLAISKFVSTDAACGVVEIIDSPTLILADWQLVLANRAFITNAGLRTMLLLSAGAISVGNVVKILATGGVAGVARVDAVGGNGNGRTVGISLDAVPAPGTLVRIAQVGQRVPVLSDGTTVIAIGDPISSASGTQGQVLKAGPAVPAVGMAMTAAAAGGGAVLFDCFVQIGTS